MAIILLALFSLALASCGGGGGGSGGGATSYTVTATAGVDGSINPASATVNSGATTSFTLTPNSGNSINTVTGCGGALVGSTYTTGAVTADCTVTASFVSNGLPTISVADANVSEGNSGTTNLNFTVSLSALANGNVDVDFATSDGSAAAGSDYTANSGTLTIPAASTSATISVSVTGDTNAESNETLTLTLSNPSGNATLGTAVATGTILDDDATGALNDTGITNCSDNAADGLACPQATHPGQDAEYGRDVVANNNSDGHAGFSFIKLDAGGNPLSATAVSWVCVQDSVTNLVWEVKTTDGDLRDMDHSYTWYNSTGINDGGAPGTANGGSCVDVNNCDTEKYVAAVNAVGLCGQTDWHLPTIVELSSLVDSAVTSPAIDSNYFPNTKWLSLKYWSLSPYADASASAWVVYPSFGAVTGERKSNANNVRLVRGGQ